MQLLLYFSCSLSSSGFVRGNVGDIPSVMSFQPSFCHGALLTVVSVTSLCICCLVDQIIECYQIIGINPVETSVQFT